MRDELTVLISSAGRRAGLVGCFREAGQALGLRLRVVATDLDPRMSAACQLADEAHQVPRVTDEGFVPAMLEIVERTGTGLIVPTIDPELMPYAEAASAFGALGARINVSPPEVIAIVRNKARTCAALEAAGVPAPRGFTLDEVRAAPEAHPWPLFAKPTAGSASRGLQVLTSVRDLAESYPEEMTIQEYLRGPEYTVNMFIDAPGDLRCVVPHRRLQVRAGEVEKGRTERSKDIRALAEGVARAVPGARGVLCFQLILDPERGPRVFEINARFGGGYPLAHQAGGRFADWLLEEATGRACSAHDGWREGVEMLRYDAAVFRG